MRMDRIFTIGCIFAALFALNPEHSASADTNCPAPPASAGPAINLTPLTLQILQDTIVPVPATDGLIHLAYAAQVTNLQTDPVEVVEVTPVDAARNFVPTGKNQQLDGDREPIVKKVRLFGQPPQTGAQTSDSANYFSKVPAGGSGIMFFDVTYRDAAAVPRLLSHKIVVTNVKTGSQSAGLTDPVLVSCDGPVVLRPPLIGHGWWNGNGCCETVNAHRAATLPANGTIRPPEQFAIDYVKIDERGGCCTGPVRDVISWPFFGVPILAAAPGKVVEMANDENEQVPGQPLVGVTVANAAGNHIIQDIGNGRFILYAHLRRGSIPAGIKVGAMLTGGQQIGDLGNTGSSTAPHLHFQVMDRPSTLNAIGLPFVFDTQMVEGVVKETPAEADRLYESGAHISVQKSGIGPQTGKMPAEGQVFGYNLK
jgi:hypothetical protein